MRLCALLAALAALACAQDLPACLPGSTNPTLKQRACYYGLRVIAPAGFFRASFAASFAQLRDSPHIRQDGGAALGERIGAFYARRAGQNAAEFLAGYLHHEPLHPLASGQTRFWARTRYAFQSVFVTRDDRGDSHLAWTPIAGAFGSGMVSIACCPNRNNVADGFSRTGFAYAGYFGTAFMREFHPEFSHLANRLLRHGNPK